MMKQELGKIGQGLEDVKRKKVGKGGRYEMRGWRRFLVILGSEGGRAAFVRPGSNHIASELQARRLPSISWYRYYRQDCRARARWVAASVGTLREIVTSYILCGLIHVYANPPNPGKDSHRQLGFTNF